MENRAFELFSSGSNDGCVAAVLGVCASVVRRFRLREGIPAGGMILKKVKVLAAVGSAPYMPTIMEVSDMTQVHPKTVRRMVKDGTFLGSYRAGNRVNEAQVLYLTDRGWEELWR